VFIDDLRAALVAEAPNTGDYGYGFRVVFEDLRWLPDGRLGLLYVHPQHDGVICGRFTVNEGPRVPTSSGYAEEIQKEANAVFYQLIEPLGNALQGATADENGLVYWDAGAVDQPAMV
jgi:hypothetical protein